MIKTLVGIIGPSTVGKSTLAKILTGPGISESVCAIPQTTHRLPRHDDTPSTVRCLTDDQFSKARFASCHGSYGLLQSDIDNFVEDNSKAVAVSVISSLDAMSLKEQSSQKTRYQTKIVLLTYHQVIEEEELRLEKVIKQLRTEGDLNRRLKIQVDMCKDLFFTEEYRNKYVDLWLCRSIIKPRDIAKRVCDKLQLDIIKNMKLVIKSSIALCRSSA